MARPSKRVGQLLENFRGGKKARTDTGHDKENIRPMTATRRASKTSPSPCQEQPPASPTHAGILSQLNLAQIARAHLVQHAEHDLRAAEVADEAARLARRVADTMPYSSYHIAASQACIRALDTRERSAKSARYVKEGNLVIDGLSRQLSCILALEKPPEADSQQPVIGQQPIIEKTVHIPPQTSRPSSLPTPIEDSIGFDLDGLAVIDSADAHGGSLDLEGNEDICCQEKGLDERVLATKDVVPPDRNAAAAALADLQCLLTPSKDDRRHKRNKEFYDLDPLSRRRLEDIRVLLGMYANTVEEEITWTKASLRAAHCEMRGPAYARRLRRWGRAFIRERDVPFNPYGVWKHSILDHEDLAQELTIYLQSLGKDIQASNILDYLRDADVQKRWKLKKTPSLATAQRWMAKLGWRWQKAPTGMYADGHERDDVKEYRQKKFLPEIRKILPFIKKWEDGEEFVPSEYIWPHDAEDGPRPLDSQEKYVLWFHDESTFYANDRRKTRWVHTSETATPYAKGKGASLMVADFVSAEYGWLRFGEESARRLFKAGKNRDGYFTTEEIVEQIEEAMRILEKHRPDEVHVFIYDNAPIHVARSPGARSAAKMPKYVSNPKTNFMAEKNEVDADGKPVYGTDGKIKKTKIRMEDGWWKRWDGQVIHQPFYYDDDHEEFPGLFKGMAKILEERGYRDCGQKGRLAECSDFNKGCVTASREHCCCRRILMNEPDFLEEKSRLELLCKSRGFKLLILPKFHCELNFIEQCWGYSKRVYRNFPPSSKECDLERNVLAALNSVPLKSMRRFQTRSLRFCDAYDKGLDGKQAAWAARKYKGHRVLPPSWKTDLEEAGISRFDGSTGVQA